MTWRREAPGVAWSIGNPPGIKLTVNGKTQQLSTGQVATLSINPSSKTPVTGRLAADSPRAADPLAGDR